MKFSPHIFVNLHHKTIDNVLESQIENSFIKKLIADLKYVYRDDIHDRQSLERNFREKFQALNKVHLTDAEFTRLMEELTNSDVYASSRKLRERNTFMRVFASNKIYHKYVIIAV